MDDAGRALRGIESTNTLEGERAVEVLLCVIGEDTNRDGLLDTPSRVVKALLEMTAGYGESPEAILSTTFAEHSDELIILRVAQLVTSSMLGTLRNNAETRSEFLRLCGTT